MKKITVLCIIACILAFSACLCSCTHDNKPPTYSTVAGKYYRYTDSGIDEEYCIEFKSDKTFIDWKSNQGTYSLDGNKITLQYDYDEKAIAYIRDDVFYFYGEYYCKSGISSPYKEYGELIYALNEDGFYRITGVTNKEITSVAIPAKINNVTVTSIDSAFKNCKSLKDVVMPDSITSIISAFYGCSSLENVTLSKNLNDLGQNAFLFCSNLKNVTLPNSLTSIGSYAFGDCSALKKIDIPNSVTNIKTGAFSNCTALTEIVIPDGVTEISSLVFDGCNNLKNMTLGKNISNINIMALSGLNSLESITVSNENETYCSINNCLIEKKTKCLIRGFSTSVIPSDGSVVKIGRLAFFGCNNLISIAIPESIKTIESDAFASCTNLTNITYDNTKDKWNSIYKREGWDINTGDYTITCTDGTINKGER